MQSELCISLHYKNRSQSTKIISLNKAGYCGNPKILKIYEDTAEHKNKHCTGSFIFFSCKLLHLVEAEFGDIGD